MLPDDSLYMLPQITLAQMRSLVEFFQTHSSEVPRDLVGLYSQAVSFVAQADGTFDVNYSEHTLTNRLQRMKMCSNHVATIRTRHHLQPKHNIQLSLLHAIIPPALIQIQVPAPQFTPTLTGRRMEKRPLNLLSSPSFPVPNYPH